MDRRKSFMLYTSQYETIKKLSTEQKAELMDAIFSYHNGVDIPLSQIVDIVFTTFREQFKIDDIKYQKICERNKENIEKRWDPKPKDGKNTSGKTGIPKNTTGKTGIPKDTRNTDDDNDDDKDNDEDIKKDTTIVVSKNAEDFLENSFEQAEFFFEIIKDKIKTKQQNPEVQIEIDPELVKFFTYWTAPMKSGKQLWKSQKTFAFKARLRNWMDKSKTSVPSSFFSTNKPAR